jgi:hypothetical protein
MEDYIDNRYVQPVHGKRTVIPTADEQFDDMYREREEGEDLGAEEEEE